MKIRKKVMSRAEIFRSLKRMAHEILEFNKGAKKLAILGIRRRGVPLAEIIRDEIEKSEDTKVPFGIIDITLYRDDLTTISHIPKVNKTDIKFDVNGKHVILVDDVLYTGRTIRAALDEIIDYGRPKSIQVAVLIDRGHRELPIMANFIGRIVPTSGNEIIEVKTKDHDKKWEVLIIENE